MLSLRARVGWRKMGGEKERGAVEGLQAVGEEERGRERMWRVQGWESWTGRV